MTPTPVHHPLKSKKPTKKSRKYFVVSNILCTFAVIKTIKVMMDASKTYTNDTLTTSLKPAAKLALIPSPPPLCKYLRILILRVSALFALSGCENEDEDQPPCPPVGGELSSDLHCVRACLSPDSLFGDWHVLSAVVPVGTSSITADVAWQGTMMEFTPDSVRFHRHDLVYPATFPGETIDVNLQIHPIKYSPDGSITIAAVPLAVSQNGNRLLLSGKNIEIEILRSPPPL